MVDGSILEEVDDSYYEEMADRLGMSVEQLRNLAARNDGYAMDASGRTIVVYDMKLPTVPTVRLIEMALEDQLGVKDLEVLEVTTSLGPGIKASGILEVGGVAAYQYYLYAQCPANACSLTFTAAERSAAEDLYEAVVPTIHQLA